MGFVRIPPMRIVNPSRTNRHLPTTKLPLSKRRKPAPPPADVQEALIAALKNGRNTAAMVEYIDAIATVPFSSDIYEISFKGGNNEILYVSKDGGYIFQADIIAVPDALNITRERREAIAAAKGLATEEAPAQPAAKSADDPPAKPGKKTGDGQFAALASELALKETKGDGKRRLWIMTAPDCSMCKTLEEQIGSISDVTLYRYLYTADDSTTQRAIAITCHHNPNEALRDYLLYGLASEDKPDEACATAAADKLRRIREETGSSADRAELPVLFFPDGEETRVLPADSDELDRWITMHQAAKTDGDKTEDKRDDTPAAAPDNATPASDTNDSDPAPTDSAVDLSDSDSSSEKTAPLDASQPPQPPASEAPAAPAAETPAAPGSDNRPPAVQVLRPQ